MLTALLAVLAVAPSNPFAPRPRPYDAGHYRIDLRLGEGGAFEGKVSITLKPKRALSEVELDSFGLSIQSAAVDGQKATFSLKEEASRRSGLLTVKAPKPLPAGKDAKVEIAYSGKAGQEHRGFFAVKDTEDPSVPPYYFTHFQTNAAQTFFPCNDQPDDKATTELFAVVDGNYQVISNGKRLKDEAFSEGGENLRRVHWLQDKPHSTYLVAVAIGSFDGVEVGGDVPATIWVPRGKMDRAFIASDMTRSALRTFESFLGVKYPWDKHDQVTVPRFTWGGMENTSLVMMRENGLVLDHKNHIYGRARITGLVAHEMAHQWFGDYVTCKWWNDTWLNEGFATYLGGIAEDAYYENDYVEVDRALDTFVYYFREEDGPRAHPLVPKSATTPEEVFDSTSYAKGAHVLRMLETWLGQAELQKGLKAYLEKHAGSNATSEDFFAAVGAATKKEKELRPFKESWLLKKGYPVLYPETSWSSGVLTVTLRQKPNHADEKGPFVFKLPIVIHRDSEPAYHEKRMLLLDRPVVTARFELKAMPQWVNWNEGGAALARINGASIGEQEWIQAARQDPDPVWRLLALLNLLGELVNPDAKEQAELTEAATGAIIDALNKDPSPYVREAVLQRLGMAKWRRLPERFAKTVLALAKRPDNLPEEAFGLIKVRRAAMELLGKFESQEGRKFLLEELERREVDLNYLPSLAVGTARLGDSVALASLRAAIEAQRPRGYPYYRAAAEALGAAETAEALPVLRGLLQSEAGNDELARYVLWRLWDNHTVKHSPEAAAMIRDFVLRDDGFSLQLRSWMIRLFDEVKTPEAKEALAAIAEKSSSEWLKASARQVLERNFPAPKPVKPGKKK
ncbi:MAG: hypothetical protein HYZ28_01515 [Myxococcales bacterium]|nr:hypothetical protein [Myxococcales bacterium]